MVRVQNQYSHGHCQTAAVGPLTKALNPSYLDRTSGLINAENVNRNACFVVGFVNVLVTKTPPTILVYKDKTVASRKRVDYKH